MLHHSQPSGRHCCRLGKRGHVGQSRHRNGLSFTPHDRPLQAVMWQGQIFVDQMLPFGLRSAPKIFNAVADALHWYLHHQGISHLLHYLDDLIMVGPPGSPIFQQHLNPLLQICGEFGVPITAPIHEPAWCFSVSRYSGTS